jgi:hypothetical protein
MRLGSEAPRKASREKGVTLPNGFIIVGCEVPFSPINGHFVDRLSVLINFSVLMKPGQEGADNIIH